MELPKELDKNNTSDSFESHSNDTKKAKEILGEIATKLSEEDLNDLVSETRFLVESWLDDFERIAFDGQTLQDVVYQSKRSK